MSAPHALVFFLFMALAALALVALANHLHAREHLRQRQWSRWRRQLAELEEAAISLEPLVESLAIVQQLAEENLTLVHQALRAEPDSRLLQAHRERARALVEDFADESRPRALNRLMDSDAQIARSRAYIGLAARVLRRRQQSGHLDEEQLELLLADLTWAHLMVQVASLVAQGHKAAARDNTLSALAYYQRAQEGLMESAAPDGRRHPMIQELSEILAGKRAAVSEHLMPETRYNPSSARLAGTAAGSAEA